LWKELASTQSLWRAIDLKKLFPKLEVIDRDVWKKHIDVKEYGLSFEGEELIDRRTVIKELYQMFASLQIENDAGITLMTLPEGLTFKKLGEFRVFPKAERPTGFSYIPDSISQDFRTDPIKKTYQVAITNCVLKDSKNPSFDKHQKFVQKFNCDMPSLLEASTLAILTYMSSKVFLYSSSLWTVTLCSEIEGIFYMVGGLSTTGLYVYTLHPNNQNMSVVAMRKFEQPT